MVACTLNNLFPPFNNDGRLSDSMKTGSLASSLGVPLRRNTCLTALCRIRLKLPSAGLRPERASALLLGFLPFSLPFPSTP